MHTPHKLPVLFLMMVALVSCDRVPVSREYEEVSLAPDQTVRSQVMGDPHASMGGTPNTLGLPPGHPDISQLPPGHPDISGLPLDHPDVSGSMMMPGTTDPAMQKALDASVVRPPLKWATPDGWNETPGSGMRMVTFTAAGDNGSVECSIVSLGGSAGGMESNVARWMRQINVAVPSGGEMSTFLSKQATVGAQGGFTLTLVDLSAFTRAGAPSMVAAIGTLPDMRIFVKMTGTHEAVLEQYDAFKSLCRSLNINP